MTEAQAVEAITQQFLTAFGALHVSDCPIALENEALTAPSKWVRLSIIPATRTQRSMGPSGSRRVADAGVIAVQVFTDVNLGIAARAGLCDDVRTALELRNLTISGSDEPVRIYAGSSRNPTTDGRWLMATVVLEYDYMGDA